MKYSLLQFSILFSILICFSCSNEEENLSLEPQSCLAFLDGEFIEVNLDQKPEYIDGGTEGWIRVLYNNLKYPAEARENGVEGTCIVQYEITEIGTVENIVVLDDPGAGIGAASENAIRVATEGISYHPAIYNDIPIRVRISISIKFKLEG